jgi:hypothetical protein
MTPKTRRDELIALRTLAEQRWAYDARMAHLSYRDMRRRVAEAPPVGLGYDLSEHTLKALVAGYRERMTDVHAIDLDEHRERELEDLDIAQRRTDFVAELAAKRLAAVDDLGVELLDEKAGKLLLDATSQRRTIGESRRKLLGLDAPTQVKADVIVHDAVTEELNAMLARAGRDPIEVRDDRG